MILAPQRARFRWLAAAAILVRAGKVRKPLRRRRHRKPMMPSVNWSPEFVRLKFRAILLISVCIVSAVSVSAAPVQVRYREGLVHGFLTLSNLEGDVIAEGDLTQVAHGDQVTSRLVFRFKDGSLQEETTVFSQRGAFHLISYNQVQKGAAFKQAINLSIAPSTGQVTVHYTDNEGNEKVEKEHLNLPPDLANGLVPTLLKNLRLDAPPLEVSMVVATPKPRLVKLVITAQGAEPFSVAGSAREATHYVVKIKIGGVAGVVAPILGKQPPDTHVWILGGEAPAFVKSEILSYTGGPMWRVELASPAWPKTADPDSKNGATAKP
jgi:hypothetical protein